MAIPKFDNVNLCSHSESEGVGCPGSRNFVESLPKVKGEFLQPGEPGSRPIVVGGVLKANTLSVLKSTIRSMQAKAGQVGTYTGEDGHAYENTEFQFYQAQGQPVKLVDGYQVQIMAQFKQLTP